MQMFPHYMVQFNNQHPVMLCGIYRNVEQTLFQRHLDSLLGHRWHKAVKLASVSIAMMTKVTFVLRSMGNNISEWL